MADIYLIVGVDQDGDCAWALKRTLEDATKTFHEMDEIAFDNCIKVYRVDTETKLGEYLAVEIPMRKVPQ
jgi:hypothetical protein